MELHARPFTTQHRVIRVTLQSLEIICMVVSQMSWIQPRLCTPLSMGLGSFADRCTSASRISPQASQLNSDRSKSDAQDCRVHDQLRSNAQMKLVPMVPMTVSITSLVRQVVGEISNSMATDQINTLYGRETCPTRCSLAILRRTRLVCLVMVRSDIIA